MSIRLMLLLVGLEQPSISFLEILEVSHLLTVNRTHDVVNRLLFLGGKRRNGGHILLHLVIVLAEQLLFLLDFLRKGVPVVFEVLQPLNRHLYSVRHDLCTVLNGRSVH